MNCLKGCTTTLFLIFWGFFAQVDAAEWDLTGLLGTVTVNQQQWQRLDMQPRIQSGAFEAVLDLELFLDNEGQVRDRGWDFSSRRKGLESILRKIHSMRYGRAGDRDRRVYLRVGTLESVTLGSGLLMRRYRNTHGAPGIKRTGLDVQMRRLFGEKITVRAVISDLLDLDGGGPVVAGRMAFHPAPRWDVGVTLVVDTDQLNALPDSIRTGRTRDAYGAASVDVVYPLIEGTNYQAKLYAGVGRVLDAANGTGLIGPGIVVEAGGLTVRGEYRWVNGRFQPGHFDALYDVNRAVVDPATGAIITREATLQPASMQGIFGEASLTLRSILLANGSYQRLVGDGTDAQIIEGRAGLSPAFIQKVPRVMQAEAFFEKRLKGTDTGGFFSGTPDTRFGYVVAVTLVPKVALVWEMEFTYEPDGTGGFRRRRTLNVQSRVVF